MTKTIRRLVMALVVTAGAAGAMAGPAFADDWNHGRDRHAQEWRGSEARGHEWREQRRYVYEPTPYAYAAPSYGYYNYVAPPPVYYAQPEASFNLVIPFSFR